MIETGDKAKDAVYNAIIELLGIKQHEIIDTNILKDDYGADSLDAVEIAMYTENNVQELYSKQINISDQEIEEYCAVRTIGDYVRLVREKIMK